jgi:hypothetical protein
MSMFELALFFVFAKKIIGPILGVIVMCLLFWHAYKNTAESTKGNKVSLVINVIISLVYFCLGFLIGIFVVLK